MFGKILVAYDGSGGADAALGRGLELAAEASWELWLVSVHDDVPDFAAPAALGRAGGPPVRTEPAGGTPAQLARLHDRAEQRAAAAGVALHADALTGNVAKRIVEYAAVGRFDLLVLGQSGRSGVWGTFLGTTADKVVRHAPCSVLVVRPASVPPAAAEAPAAPAAATSPAPGRGTTATATVACPSCGEPNASDALVCAHCRDVMPLRR